VVEPNYTSKQPINMLNDGKKHNGQQDEYAKLQKTVEALAMQLVSRSYSAQTLRNFSTKTKLLWTGRTSLQAMSFKLLQPASIKGGQPLALIPVIHHPASPAQGKHYNINSILKVGGLIGNSSVQFLIDSRTAVSVVCYGALDSYYQQQITTANTSIAVIANGTALELVGQIIISINTNGFQSNQLFMVVHNLTVDCILGADCLLQHSAVIDCKQQSITMKGVGLYHF